MKGAITFVLVGLCLLCALPTGTAAQEWYRYPVQPVRFYAVEVYVVSQGAREAAFRFSFADLRGDGRDRRVRLTWDPEPLDRLPEVRHLGDAEIPGR